MKKARRWTILLLAALFAALVPVACGTDGTAPETPGGDETTPGTETPGGSETFTGLSFADCTVTYDGTTHEITITGELPAGAEVRYTGNKGTDAGRYEATAIVTKEGYETLTLDAVLTIEKAVFTGITFADKTVIATGREQSIEIAADGGLPAGTEVRYENNTGTEPGTYQAVAVVSNPNYETLTLRATLTINGITDVAADIIGALMDRPDPWSFLPEAFRPESMAYETMPVGGMDGFTAFVDVDSIGRRSIGKQMYVLYDALTTAGSLINGLDTVFSAGQTIAGLYQTYINENPDDYASFSGEALGLRFKITLNGEASELLAGNATVSAKLTYDGDTGERSGRVQLTDGAAIRYVATDEHLTFAYKITVAGVGQRKQLEFIREDGAVAGYLYEMLGTESAALKTTAVIASDAEKTIIMSDKRETDDMLINGYEEVYDSRTGEFIGGEVQETVKAVDYDTLWFNLYDVSGFETVKVADESNDMNADTVYVNGGTEPFATKAVGLAGLLRAPSRRFDVEMKEVWYVVRIVDGDDVSYETVKTSVPMVFAQKPEYKTFGEDVRESNPGLFATNPLLPADAVDAIGADYTALQELFLTIKESVTYADIEAFIGENDPFFETTD